MDLRVPKWSILLAVVALSLPSRAPAQQGCQPGRYASASTGACEPCDLGHYQPAIGQEACFQCEAGRFADSPGRTACDQCGPGRYQGLMGATVCNGCDAGTFRDATGQTSCATCEAGRYGHSTGASSCDSCGPGKFSGGGGATVCASCGVGRYASDGATSCRSCDPGKYADALDSTACRTCAPGKYSGIAGATVCDACAPGKFSGATVDAVGDPQYATTCTAPNAYNCYKTKDLKTLVLPPSTLTVSDAYAFSVSTKVKGPAMVCAPVDVGSGVEDSSKRQCCYKVSAPGLPKPHPRVKTAGGTFTGSSLEVLKSQLICEPCGADLVP